VLYLNKYWLKGVVRLHVKRSNPFSCYLFTIQHSLEYLIAFIL